MVIWLGEPWEIEGNLKRLFWLGEPWEIKGNLKRLLWLGEPWEIEGNLKRLLQVVPPEFAGGTKGSLGYLKGSLKEKGKGKMAAHHGTWPPVSLTR